MFAIPVRSLGCDSEDAVDPVSTGRPLLSHWISGVGTPWALHWIVILFPTITCGLTGVLVDSFIRGGAKDTCIDETDTCFINIIMISSKSSQYGRCVHNHNAISAQCFLSTCIQQLKYLLNFHNSTFKLS